jgi:hypothetical protein
MTFTIDEIKAHDESVANFNAWRKRQVSLSPDERMGGSVLVLAAVYISLLLGSAAAWVTHVIVCIQHAAWVLLAFGCIVAPVGVVHGVGVWLGVF